MKTNKKRNIIRGIIILTFVFGGFGFMYWGYTTVAHPKSLPECKEIYGFSNVTTQTTAEKGFFHKIYNIEPYKGPTCVSEESANKKLGS